MSALMMKQKLPVATTRNVVKTIGSRRPVVVRSTSEEKPTTSAPLADLPSVSEPMAAVEAAPVQQFSFLNSTNEAINGRAAMMGFVAAVIAENLTHHTVFSQIAGKYVNEELVEKSFAASDLTFGMIIALVTVGSMAPLFLEQKGVDSRSFGPFTPGLEKTLGRAAMMGFSALLMIEAVKGSSLF